MSTVKCSNNYSLKCLSTRRNEKRLKSSFKLRNIANFIARISSWKGTKFFRGEVFLLFPPISGLINFLQKMRNVKYVLLGTKFDFFSCLTHSLRFDLFNTATGNNGMVALSLGKILKNL